ncbi:PAS domain-containing protein [Stieleria sp. JC731]|uniref:ATP-binding protein n=1 Tax=Pirellulaceae TaxID=2691357 RepID=UPI001E336270|nr:HAMP domain-containing sensor histidine kinase [Stieleria sp. JC731]MCC9601685.1 PAS domain-containing protein [Stieleria sp. JC731]
MPTQQQTDSEPKPESENAKVPDSAVRNLALFGLVAATVVFGVLFWSMSQIQQDRALRDDLAEAVNDSIVAANNLITQSVHYTNPLLQNEQPSGAAPNLDWTEPPLNPGVLGDYMTEMQQTVQGMQTAIGRLSQFNHDCAEFAERLRDAQSDRDRCLTATRAAIVTLRTSLNVDVGEEALRQAILLREFRRLSGDEKQISATEYLRNVKPVYQLGTETDEVVELESLCDRLYAITERELLIDMKDNYLAGCLARLEREVVSNEHPEKAEIHLGLLKRIEHELLGRNFKKNVTYQTIDPGSDGLFNACDNWLRLLDQRRKLEDRKNSTIDDFALARNKLVADIAKFSRGSSDVASRAIRNAMLIILFVGAGFGLIFSGIARKISQTILNQFNALQDQATRLETVSEELRSSAQHLSLLSLVAKYTDNAVAITDPDGTVQWINEGFERMTRYRSKDIVGHNWCERWEKSDIDDEDFKTIRKALEDQCGIDMVLKATGRFDEQYWIELEMRPILHDCGGVRIIWIERDVSAKVEAQKEAESLNEELRTAERYAGMAEVATGVLHNVGNVLNSVNVSANLLRESIGNSELKSLTQIASLLNEHKNDLPTFLSDESKSEAVVSFVNKVSDQLTHDQDEQLEEIYHLFESIEHIKAIVTSQQSFARLGSGSESLSPEDLIENAITLHSASLNRHGVEVIKLFKVAPAVHASKHDVLQILVNLIKNAQQACSEDEKAPKNIEIDVKQENDIVHISVKDYGMGISKENLTKIFRHGFTTKDEGHGFGLHSCANAAAKMGGSLKVESDGVGQGAKFTLTLPTADSVARGDVAVQSEEIEKEMV